MLKSWDTKTLFTGKNLLLQVDSGDSEANKLFLGLREPNTSWVFFDIQKAKEFRDALDRGIAIMESGAKLE